MDYQSMQLHQLADGLRARDFSSRELTEAVFSTIERKEPVIGAYITLTRDLAMRQADRVDELLSAGLALPPLAGIPGALKDNIATSGIRTTNASRMLADFVPPYDAFVWRILKQQEMVLTGKVNMDEFAMGHSTETSAFHVTRNPYDKMCIRDRRHLYRSRRPGGRASNRLQPRLHIA